MITAGVDVGAKVIKVVILGDGQILSQVAVQTTREKQRAASEAIERAAGEAGIAREDIKHITGTGSGAQRVVAADGRISVGGANARGATWLYPSCRTVIDVGAEQVGVAKCSPKGRVADFATNEKCAAGAGTFIEAVARALEVKLEEMGPLALRSENDLSINSQCAVFAESEVVSLIHSGATKEDIANAVHDAIARRITSLVLRLGIDEDVVLAGGVARDAGLAKAITKSLHVDLHIPDEPEFLSALGAALVAADGGEGN